MALISSKRDRCRLPSWLAGIGVICFGLAAAAQAIAGRWELIDYNPKQAKKAQIALWLRSDVWVDNPAPTNPYDAKGMPLLSIQCQDGQPEFFINLNFEVPQGAVAVTYRLDEGEAMESAWMTESVSIRPSDHIALVRSMLGKNKLFLTISFPNAKPTSTVFEIAGLDKALQLLRPHCSW
jgi:Type VI secretion system VasI, EvfG, VC_A0118